MVITYKGKIQAANNFNKGLFLFIVDKTDLRYCRGGHIFLEVGDSPKI
jgi:hypothetical protein